MLEVYITDLSAYNQGYLLGEWVTLPLEAEQLAKKIEGILYCGSSLCFMENGYYEKHEEYFVTDYEWSDIDLFDIDEYVNR